MTRAADIRARVIALDATGGDAEEIGFYLGIPVARVERILDDHDAAQGVPHPARESAPILEPLGGTAVINSQAAIGGGRDLKPKLPKRQPVAGKKPRAVKDGGSRPTGGQWKDIECGTLSGYYRHRRLKEKPCKPCGDAYIAHDREQRPRKRGPIECGTMRGYKRHRNAREKPCADCYEAYNAQRRAERAALAGKSIHGTADGYAMHLRNKQKPCDLCAPCGRPTRAAVNEKRTALYRQGRTDREIGDALGIPRAAVTKWRQRQDLAANREVS